MSIVPGDIDDLPAIMPIMHAAFDPTYGEAWSIDQCRALLSLPQTYLHLATLEGQIAGFAMTRHVLDEVELLLIAVNPARQREGIGAQLLSGVISALAETEARKLFLEAREGNSAVGLYSRFGFFAIGKRIDYYKGRDGQRRNALTYVLELRA